MKAQALLRVSLTVADLPAMGAFYCAALGFTQAAPRRAGDPGACNAGPLEVVRLARGGQTLELARFAAEGAPYPADRHSNDAWFQHLALVTGDMATAFARLQGFAHESISRGGPQRLPGGIVAYKFRDPEGHPLELIQFPAGNPATAGGIDHSAIVVADVPRSVAFYTGVLGFAVSARQVNAGPAQDALDGLDDTDLDVVALTPGIGAHVELLGYRAPVGRTAAIMRPADLAASRLVILVDSLVGQPGATPLANGGRAALVHDPDGHALILMDSDGAG